MLFKKNNNNNYNNNSNNKPASELYSREDPPNTCPFAFISVLVIDVVVNNNS